MYPTSKRGAEIVVNVLKQKNVSHVFGYSGGAILPVLNEFYNSNIRFIMNRTEQCAGHAAQGFAKASGKMGVVITTSGPGLTNISTAALDAKNDNVPMLILSGQVPTTALGTKAFQEADYRILKEVTKEQYQITDSNEIEVIMNKAIEKANEGKKGPVHVDLPKDIMMKDVIEEEQYIYTANKNIKKDIDKDNLDKVINLIHNSKKPIVIAGHGTVDCHYTVREFIHRSKIPITTTIHAVGVFNENHYLSLHMLGMHGSAYANIAVQEADLILAVGSRFCDRTTGNLNGFAPNAKNIVHFNIDDVEFDRVVKSDYHIKGDCYDSLEYLCDKVDIDINRDKWHKRIKELKNRFPFTYKLNNPEQLKTQNVIKIISNKTQHLKNLIITTGVGNHQMMACQFYRWQYPRSLLTSGSLGTMGVGIPYAIGAQIAKPKSRVFVIDGDGSFNMTSTDLGTIAELHLPIKIFIMNDGRQQMVHTWQKLFFNERFIATTNKNPDYVKLAESYGIKAFKITNIYEMNKAISLAINDVDNPILFDCRVQPDICLPLVAPGKNLDDMILNDDQKIILDGLAPN